MTRLDRAAMVATVAAFLMVPWSLPVAAQATEPTILETSTECSTGACVPTPQLPVEGTVMRCLVFPSIPNTSYLVRCIDMFLGTLVVDPRENGYSGSLVCTRMSETSCPDVVQTTIKDHSEPLSMKQKLDCTIVGSIFTDSLRIECVPTAA